MAEAGIIVCLRQTGYGKISGIRLQYNLLTLKRDISMRIVFHCLIFFLFALFVVSCSDSSDNQSSENLTALVELAALQNELNNLALEWFSENGQKPIFDESVSWPTTNSDEAIKRYDQLYDLADNIEALRPQIEAAIFELSSSIETADMEGSARLSAKIGLSSWFPSIFGWLDSQYEEARNNILSVMNKTDDYEKQKFFNFVVELRNEGRLSDDKTIDIGNSADTFLTKLSSGELDRTISLKNVHRYAQQDSELEYGAIAIENSLDTGSVAAKQGGKGLIEGGKSLVDSSVTIVSGGLGKAGALFKSGFEKTSDLVNGIISVEEKQDQPVELLKDVVESKLKSRIQDFLGNNVGLDDTTSEILAEELKDGVRKKCREVMADTRIIQKGQNEVDVVLSEGLGLSGLEIKTGGDAGGAIIEFTSDKGDKEIKFIPGNLTKDHKTILPGSGTAEVSLLCKGESPKAGGSSDPVTLKPDEIKVVTPPEITEEDETNDCGFSCNNGDCLDSSQHCDGVFDCATNEDEYNCGTDEIWTDPLTNLEWLIDGNPVMGKTWDDANNYCKSKGNWRLPNLDELRTLIVNCANTQTGGECPASNFCADTYACVGEEGSPCFGCSSDCYLTDDLVSSWGCNIFVWSSTKASDDSSLAWGVEFSRAMVTTASTIYTQAARCVR